MANHSTCHEVILQREYGVLIARGGAHGGEQTKVLHGIAAPFLCPASWGCLRRSPDTRYHGYERKGCVTFGEQSFPPLPGFVGNYFSGWTVGRGPGVAPLIFGGGRKRLFFSPWHPALQRPGAQDQASSQLLDMCS